jgi:hypothetical protein
VNQETRDGIAHLLGILERELDKERSLLEDAEREVRERKGAVAILERRIGAMREDLAQ